MRTVFHIAVLTALLVGIAGCSTGNEDAASSDKSQTTCPVMGGKINKNFHVDHGGKRIYMCCPGCTAKIKADPAKHIKKLEDEGVVIAQTPANAEQPAEEEDHSGHQH